MTMLFVDSSPMLIRYMKMLAEWGVTPEAIRLQSSYQADYLLEVANIAECASSKGTAVTFTSPSGQTFNTIEGIALCNPTLWLHIPKQNLPIYCLHESAALQLQILNWPSIQLDGALCYSSFITQLLKTVRPCHLLIIIADHDDHILFNPLVQAGFTLSFYSIPVFRIQLTSATVEKIAGSRYDGLIFFEPEDSDRFCKLAIQNDLDLSNKLAFVLNDKVQAACECFGHIQNAASGSRWKLLSMVTEWVSTKNAQQKA